MIAQAGGADRVEICKDKSTDGITPLFETVEALRDKLNIELNVMIRPRAGLYVYSDDEFEQIKRDVIRFKELKVDGLVFGVLDESNQLHIPRNKELIELAYPLPCTFHRAFDVVKDVYRSLEDCIHCGFTTILTSAQQKSAMEGIDTLIKLVQQANNRIIIMPGGGVRSTNVLALKNNLGMPYYHSSAITDGGEIADLNEIRLLKAVLS